MENLDFGQQFQIFSKTSKAILKFGAFGGRMQISVNVDRKGRPELGEFISSQMGMVIEKTIEKLVASPPNTKLPITQSKWNTEDSKYKLAYILNLIKDEAGCYRAEVQFQHNGAAMIESFDFTLSGIEVGTEPMAAPTKSEYSILSLLRWFTQPGPITAAFTKTKWKPDAGSTSSGSVDKDNPFA